jgi:hypothetical protein
MGRYALSSFVLITLLAFMPLKAAAEWSIGASVTDGKLSSFSLSIGSYYKIPDAEINVFKRRNVSDSDMSVALFLSTRAKVSNSVILDLRLSGMSWMDISLKYGIGGDAYYVPIKGNPGPPYGKAYGYYKNKPKSQWSSIRLSDTEITDMVNLKFLSEHHGISADDVIDMRGSGKDFSDIDGDIKRGKGNNKSRGNGSSNGKSKGKGKKK